MPNDSSPIQIDLTPRFQKDLRVLAKRYRRIRSDLQPLISQLQAGELRAIFTSGVRGEIRKGRILLN